ncbi:hypothetical protein MTR_7g082120 [Medicago truncatula]|uniref:Uncharacterized protein n=1 Tax=Medicago truncatula TaxID=3880 RepID=G7KUA2_MEDTR|nr:hypothetical protein MTR_7g082120 [Medicago truncatula]
MATESCNILWGPNLQWAKTTYFFINGLRFLAQYSAPHTLHSNYSQRGSSMNA